MRAHLRSESVLERCDDAAARGVVLWVRARDHEQVERQAHAIAADLHVLLFHDVEQADLDPFREVGQLVDAEDSTVGAWQQPVMDGQLICEIAAFGDLDGVHLADLIGEVDPIKVAEGRYLPDDSTIHYGLAPSNNAGTGDLEDQPVLHAT